MGLYRIINDCLKLFLMNVFLYAVFLEFYWLGYLLQDTYGFTLPFFGVFISGVFGFVAVIVWMGAAKMLYRTVETVQDMAIRSMVSEIPIVLLVLISWLLFVARAIEQSADIRMLLILFTGSVVVFPFIMIATKQHSEQVTKLEH